MLLPVLVAAAPLVLAAIAIRDVTHKRHAVTHTFPVIGHFRYLLEELGPPLRQDFFTSDLPEKPYNRVTRSWVDTSAKGENNCVGFGSQVEHNEPWKTHILPSLYPTLDTEVAEHPRPRVIGEKRGLYPYPETGVPPRSRSTGALDPSLIQGIKDI